MIRAAEREGSIVRTVSATGNVGTIEIAGSPRRRGAPRARGVEPVPVRWSELGGLDGLTVDELGSVAELCESLHADVLVDYPGLLARWARAKASIGDYRGAVATSQIASSLTFEPAQEWFRQGEVAFQERVARLGAPQATEQPQHRGGDESHSGPDQGASGNLGSGTGDPKVTSRGETGFTVSVLGSLEVRLGSEVVDTTAWGKSKARLLFISLILEQGRDLPRDVLLERLWPRLSPEVALNNFYVTWNGVKRALGTRGRPGDPLMPVHNAGLRCAMLRDRCRVDLDDFVDLVTTARAARVRGDLDQSLEAYRSLSALYRGDVLPGDTDAEWVAPYREMFHTQFLDAMAAAARIAIDAGEPDEAVWFANRGLRADAEREALFELVVEASIASGRRDEGVRAYLRCRSMLAEEYGLDPSARMQELYQRLLSMQ